MSQLMQTERYTVETHEGSVHSSVVKTRCKLCQIETKGGHLITGCVFTLMQRIRKLEAACKKAGVVV